MSILDRLNLLIRSEISDLSRGGSFKNAMSEMEGSLRDARRQRAEMRRSEASLVRQIREARETSTRWEDRAVLALRTGDEELAREALIMKNRALDEATRYRDELDDYRAQIQDIERALEALEMKLDGARGRLESSHDTGRSPGGSRRQFGEESAWDAEMKKRRGTGTRSERRGGDHLGPLDDMTDFGAGRSFDEFDRMSSKINAMEADVEAENDLAYDDPLIDPRRQKLDEVFDRMERKKKNDDDLADLKKKFE